MSFQVSLSDNARENVDAILTWIGQRSPQGAATWADRWDEVLESIAEFADSCSRAPESDYHNDDIRHKVFKTRRGKPYRALFVIRGDNVIVIHVRGPGQDLVPENELDIPEG